jgi:PilZ domain
MVESTEPKLRILYSVTDRVEKKLYEKDNVLYKSIRSSREKWSENFMINGNAWDVIDFLWKTQGNGELKMNPGIEKRRHPRHPALFRAKYTVSSSTYRDFVRDVSAGGIYIGTLRNFNRGQRVNLRFPVVAFDRRPGIMGTVVRSQESGFAVMFDHPIEEERYQKGQLAGFEFDRV